MSAAFLQFRRSMRAEATAPISPRSTEDLSMTAPEGCDIAAAVFASQALSAADKRTETVLSWSPRGIGQF